MSEYSLEKEWKKDGAHQHFTTWLCDKIESMRDGISDMKTQLTERAEAAEARAAQLEAENQRIMAEADRQVKFYQDLVHTVQAERDEARRQLEQARQVCAYWLHDARFIVANTKEHNEAVEMLKVVVGDSH